MPNTLAALGRYTAAKVSIRWSRIIVTKLRISPTCWGSIRLPTIA